MDERRVNDEKSFFADLDLDVDVSMDVDEGVAAMTGALAKP